MPLDLLEVDVDVFAALNARSIELTGRALRELPADVLWAVLESMRRDLSRVLLAASESVTSG